MKQKKFFLKFLLLTFCLTFCLPGSGNTTYYHFHIKVRAHNPTGKGTVYVGYSDSNRKGGKNQTTVEYTNCSPYSQSYKSADADMVFTVKDLPDGYYFHGWSTGNTVANGGTLVKPNAGVCTDEEQMFTITTTVTSNSKTSSDDANTYVSNDAKFPWKEYYANIDQTPDATTNTLDGVSPIPGRYYHIRSLSNTNNTPYASFIGEIPSSWSTSTSLDKVIKLEDKTTAYSDPGAVCQVLRGNYTNFHGQLAGNGTNSYARTGNWMELRYKSDISFIYYVNASFYFTDKTTTLGASANESSACKFAFEPLDEEHMDKYYFGAAPNSAMEQDGKYYTTMYTAFPYKCMDDVKAYYISSLNTDNTSGIATAVCTEISSGLVPANTGVILECTGTDPAHNRLVPLTSSVAALSGNLLSGACFGSAGNTSTAYDSNTMRVFSTKSGKIGFYKYSGSTIGANKAYLDISSLSSASNSFVLAFDEDNTTGIHAIGGKTPATSTHDNIYYNMMGMKVANPVKGQLYIYNGKKIIY